MSNEVEQIVQQTEALLRLRNEETLQETTPQRLHECLGEVVMVHINDNWVKTKKRQTAGRRAFYFSAEYLVGRSFMPRPLQMDTANASMERPTAMSSSSTRPILTPLLAGPLPSRCAPMVGAHK